MCCFSMPDYQSGAEGSPDTGHVLGMRDLLRLLCAIRWPGWQQLGCVRSMVSAVSKTTTASAIPIISAAATRAMMFTMACGTMLRLRTSGTQAAEFGRQRFECSRWHHNLFPTRASAFSQGARIMRDRHVARPVRCIHYVLPKHSALNYLAETTTTDYNRTGRALTLSLA